MEKRTSDDLIPSEPSTRSKRRRSSITNEFNDDLISSSNFSLTRNRKRSAEDDLISYSSSSLLRDFDSSIRNENKRMRYESELENQPPRCSVTRQQGQDEENHFASTWDHLHTLFPSDLQHHHHHSIYHRTNSTPNSNGTFPAHFSSLLPEHHHSSSIYSDNSFLLSNDKLSKINPLRKTNFFLDNKQTSSLVLSSATAAAASSIIRTGNISPAHSDSSSESTSTCSSDDQLHHPHLHFHQTQPWRTYRERENYEQLLDLAEKLADPNRFNQVNIDKFISYRYQLSILNSQQTACVICMSHFKNNQHIRVLPCQHEYHSKCIARWFTMNSSCPICRRDNFL